MFSKETHILVVDDSVNMRRIVVGVLQRMGFFKVTSAKGANEAFEKLKIFVGSPQAFGLVLSDLNMPGPSGLELLRQLRTDVSFSQLPFILVTTESEKSAVIDAVASGVSGYVVKPFGLDILRKKIEDVWKKHNP